MPIRLSEISIENQPIRLSEVSTETAPIRLSEVEKPESSILGEFGKSIIRESLNVVKGFVGTEEAFVKVNPFLKRAYQKEMPMYVPGKGWTKKTGYEVLAQGKEILSSAAEKYPRTSKGAAQWAGSVIGAAIPYMGAALAGGYIAGPAGAAMVGFSVEGDAAYDEAKQRGASETSAQLNRVIVGSINAGIEALQIGQIMKFAKGTGKHSFKAFVGLVKNKAYKELAKEGVRFSGKILKHSINEGIEEFAQEGVSIITPAILEGYLPKTPEGKTDWSAIGNRLGEAALGGAVAGGVLGGVAGIVESGIEENGKLIEPEPAIRKDLKDKIIDTIKSREVIEKRAEVRPEIIKEHAERGGEYQDMLQRLTQQKIDPIEANKIASSVLQGQYPGTDIDFVSLKEKLSDSEMNETFQTIITDERLLPFQRKNLMDAWEKLANGKLPTKGEIKLISDFIDPDIAKALLSRRSWGERAWSKFLSSMSFPKAIMASFDLSAFRQACVLGPLATTKFVKIGKKSYAIPFLDWKPIGMMLKTGINSLGSNKYAQLTMQKIETNPMYGLLQASKVELTDWKSGKTILNQYEEAFQSELSQRIWGVRQSERAFIVMLNQWRADTFYKFAEHWHGDNKPMSDYKGLGQFINHATGRGTIPKYMQGVANFANAVFFSPKLALSRFQTVYDLIKPNQSLAVRKLVATDLVSGVGMGLAALFLFSMIPGITVERDPRNSDFGKIKYGNTRIDFWAGYSQIARTITQMILNQQKATSTGRVYKPGRTEVFTRFLESKLNPAVGAALDIYRGQTFFGEEIKPEAPFVVEQIWQRITPLFIQDVVDAIRFQGLGTATAIAPAAFFGIGAMTYPESTSGQSFRLKDYYAKQVFGQKWDDIGDTAQETLRTAYPQIAEFENQIRFERENWDFISKIQEENVAIGKEIQNSLSKDVRDNLNSISFKLSGLSRYIGRGWYLNDKRYNEYKSSVKQDLQNILPKVMNTKIYNSMDVISKRDFLDKLVTQIKKIRREEIKDSALKKDLINLMEIKNAGK